jgi:hypothetical protein
MYSDSPLKYNFGIIFEATDVSTSPKFYIESIKPNFYLYLIKIRTIFKQNLCLTIPPLVSWPYEVAK